MMRLWLRRHTKIFIKYSSSFFCLLSRSRHRDSEQQLLKWSKFKYLKYDMYIVQPKILYCFKVKNKAGGIDFQQSYTAKDCQVKWNSKTHVTAKVFLRLSCLVLFVRYVSLSGHFSVFVFFVCLLCLSVRRFSVFLFCLFVTSLCEDISRMIVQRCASRNNGTSSGHR